MILDLIQQSLGNREMDQIGSQLGTGPQQTQQAVAAALPLLLGALGRNTAEPQGARALVECRGARPRRLDSRQSRRLPRPGQHQSWRRDPGSTFLGVGGKASRGASSRPPAWGVSPYPSFSLSWRRS